MKPYSVDQEVQASWQAVKLKASSPWIWCLSLELGQCLLVTRYKRNIINSLGMHLLVNHWSPMPQICSHIIEKSAYQCLLCWTMSVH